MKWDIVCTVDGLKRTLWVRSDATRGFSNPKLYKKPQPARCTGFTLLEMMIAITVAAILLATAVPSLRQFRANNKVTAASNSIVTALNVARFNAVTRGENVLICPSSDSVSCSHGSWYKGWIVFRENGLSNDADDFTPAEADIIRVGVQTGELKQDPGFTASIVFEADGTTSATGADLVIDVCYSDTGLSKRHRQISINPFGLISSESVTTLCS
jgi:type IV fimbrial biogenesis protein FimT